MTRFLFHSCLPATLALVVATGVAWNQNRAMAEECGEFGTSVIFADSPIEAAKQALEEEKLVFVLHVSGLFEDSDFTWNNAEALRVNALANPEVGKYLNEYFVSAFQKVGTFRIVGGRGGAKQGGNVASYFCATDGRVLHVVAGPVNAATLLKEAKWVVDSVKATLVECEKNGKSFKAEFRKLHADRLRKEHGLTVQPVAFDAPAAGEASAISYRDPSGKPLGPVLKTPPIEGPDVSLSPAVAAEFNKRQEVARKSAGALGCVLDIRGGRWALGNQGRVHRLMAAHSMKKIETVYGSIFEGILGEKVSTKPVVVTNPFPWHRRGSIQPRLIELQQVTPNGQINLKQLQQLQLNVRN